METGFWDKVECKWERERENEREAYNDEGDVGDAGGGGDDSVRVRECSRGHWK